MEVDSVADRALRQERRPSLFIYQLAFALGVYYLTGQNVKMTASIWVFHFFLWHVIQFLARA